MNNKQVESAIFFLSKENNYLSLTFSSKTDFNLENSKLFESFIHTNVKNGERIFIDFSNLFNLNKESRDYLKANFKFPENCKVALYSHSKVSQFILALSFSFLISDKIQRFTSISVATDWLLKD